MRIKMRFSYKRYPLSNELTEKSARVGSLTHPVFGVALGLVPFLGVMLSSSMLLSTILLIFGMFSVVLCPALLYMYRRKKFEEYDEEYKMLIKQIQESGVSPSEFLFAQIKSRLSSTALEFCEKNAGNLPKIRAYLGQITAAGVISENELEILLEGYRLAQDK